MGEEDDDPDWLRAFQAPSREPVMLSSGSDSSPSNTPTRTGPSRGGGKRGKKTTTRRKSLTSQKEDALGKQEEGPSVEEKQDKSSRRLTPKKGLVTLSSDSDASPGNSPPRAGQANQEDNVKEESSIRNGSRRDGPQAKGKKPKSTHAKTGTDQTDDASEHQEEGLAEEDMQYKLPGNSVSQRLPLIFPDKVQRSKALIECDGDSMDMSGDIGAVGRIVISNGPTGNQELLLDLKGTIYKSTIVPSRTFCVVSIGQTEAKIETIMNDFIQLEPQSNLFEAETMMEGTLDGFTFDSDEEGDKIPDLSAHQNDQNNEEEDQPKGKKKRKAAKPAGKGQKKAKVTVKTAKKGARKTRATKATKKTKKTKK